MALPTFRYATPDVAVSGAISDINSAKVDTGVFVGTDGTSSGKVALEIVQAFSTSGPRTIQRTRTAGARRFLGFVAFDAGKPGDPDRSEYIAGEAVPVCSAGRQWVFCENFAVAPVSVDSALFFARDSGGATGAIGNLRYGDNDGGTCTAIPPGSIRVLRAKALAGGAALLELDFDLTRTN